MKFKPNEMLLLIEALSELMTNLNNSIVTCPDVVAFSDALQELEDNHEQCQKLSNRLQKAYDKTQAK